MIDSPLVQCSIASFSHNVFQTHSDLVDLGNRVADTNFPQSTIDAVIGFIISATNSAASIVRNNCQIIAAQNLDLQTILKDNNFQDDFTCPPV
jgi:hypothetical protein